MRLYFPILSNGTVCICRNASSLIKRPSENGLPNQWLDFEIKDKWQSIILVVVINASKIYEAKLHKLFELQLINRQVTNGKTSLQLYLCIYVTKEHVGLFLSRTEKTVVQSPISDLIILLDQIDNI